MLFRCLACFRLEAFRLVLSGFLCSLVPDPYPVVWSVSTKRLSPFPGGSCCCAADVCFELVGWLVSSVFLLINLGSLELAVNRFCNLESRT